MSFLLWKNLGPEVYLCPEINIYTTILLRKRSFTSIVNPFNDPIRPKLLTRSRIKLWVTIWATFCSTWAMFRHSFVITLLPITSSYLLISWNVFLYEIQLKIVFITLHYRLTGIPTHPWRFESCVLLRRLQELLSRWIWVPWKISRNNCTCQKFQSCSTSKRRESGPSISPKS